MRVGLRSSKNINLNFPYEFQIQWNFFWQNSSSRVSSWELVNIFLRVFVEQYVSHIKQIQWHCWVFLHIFVKRKGKWSSPAKKIIKYFSCSTWKIRKGTRNLKLGKVVHCRHWRCEWMSQLFFSHFEFALPLRISSFSFLNDCHIYLFDTKRIFWYILCLIFFFISISLIPWGFEIYKKTASFEAKNLFSNRGNFVTFHSDGGKLQANFLSISNLLVSVRIFS